jgi:regulator of RNase E activity RraA
MNVSAQIPSLLEAFRGKPTSVISDNLDRLPGPVGLRPFHSGQQLLGRALTVRTRAGDNLAVHQALDLVKPGSVIVVDGGGDVSRALRRKGARHFQPAAAGIQKAGQRIWRKLNA